MADRPEVGDITTSDLLEGFNWILSITDRSIFYSSKELKEALINSDTRIDTIPIISITSFDNLLDGINSEIDAKLDFVVEEIKPLTDNQIIVAVITNVGLLEQVEDTTEFNIEPRTIILDTPYTPQPKYVDTDSTAFYNTPTELKPTSPPAGYFPIFARKVGSLSSGGQWRWSGNSWVPN